jgi:hypothetical protein
MEKLTREQLIRRIKLIQEDVKNLINALQSQGVDTTIENKKGTSVDTYVSNIYVCTEIDSNGVPTDEDGYRVETEWVTEEERQKLLWEKKKAPYDV